MTARQLLREVAGCLLVMLALALPFIGEFLRA